MKNFIIEQFHESSELLYSIIVDSFHFSPSAVKYYYNFCCFLILKYFNFITVLVAIKLGTREMDFLR